MIEFKGADKPKELVPVGAHVAILYSIIELGTMTGEYMGETKTQRKIRLTWELPDEKREFDGEMKPMVIGKKYTISLFEQAKLRPVVVGMLGSLSEKEEEEFDIKSLLGKPCMVQVTHEEYNGNKYANVASVTQLPKSIPAPVQFNPSQYLDYKEGWDDEVFNKLPKFVQEQMGESEEMKRRKGYPTAESEGVNPEDIPF